MIRKTIILLLVVATLGMTTAWVAGLFSPCGVDWDLTEWMWARVVSTQGQCMVFVADFSVYKLVFWDKLHPGDERRDGVVKHKETFRQDWQRPIYRQNALGFSWQFSSAPPWVVGVRFVVLPFWVPCLFFGAYPTLAFIGFIRGRFRCWHRRRNGLCPACGYDLQGNVSGVCPECGKEVVIA